MEYKNTQQKIFDAAVELFYQKGYAGTSVREIARMVGIKESSIYNHYSNKEEILDCILDDFKKGIASNRPSENELVNLVAAISPAEIIKLIFLRYVRNEDVKIDKIARIIFIEQYINERAGDFFMKYMVEEPIAYYKRIFSMLAAAGRIKDSDYTSLAEELHYGFLGLMMEQAHGKIGEQRDDKMLKKMVRHVDFVFEHVQII